MAEKKSYKFSITFWKGFRILIEVLIAGAAVKYGNSPYFLALAPVIEMGINYFKNRNN